MAEHFITRGNVQFQDIDLRGRLFDGNGLDIDVHDSLSISQHLTVYGDLSSGGFFFVDNETNRVGIGTTDPIQLLDIFGTDPTVGFDDSGVKWRIGMEASSFKIVRTGIFETLDIDPTSGNMSWAQTLGNVGIGFLDSTAKLGVLGDVSISGDLSVDDVIRLGNTGGAPLAFNAIGTSPTLTPSSFMDTADDLYVAGDVEIDNRMSIAGDLTVGGTIFSSGGSSQFQDIDVLGVIFDSGGPAVDVRDDLSVSGTLTVANVFRVGNTEGGAAFNVIDDDATIDSTWTRMNASNDLFVEGDMEILGDFSFGGNITIAGVIFGDDFTQISGPLTSDDLDIRGNIFDGSSDAAPVDVNDHLLVSGDLTVDTNTLYVDSSANRVGIRKVNPTVELEVNGDLSAGDSLFVDLSTERVGIGTTAPQALLDLSPSGTEVGLRIDPDQVGYSGDLLNISTATTSGAVSVSSTGTFNIPVGSQSDLALEFGAGTGNGFHFAAGGIQVNFAASRWWEFLSTQFGPVSTDYILRQTTSAGAPGFQIGGSGTGIHGASGSVVLVSGGVPIFQSMTNGVSVSGDLSVSDVIRLGNTESAPVVFNAIDDDSTVSNTTGGLMDAANDLYVEGDIEVSQDVSIAQSLTARTLFIAGSSIDAARIHDDDDDTEVHTEANNDEDMIRFTTDGTERMIIDNTGFVGVGTSAPGALLDLSPSGATIGLRVDADQSGYSGDLISVNTVTTAGAFTVTEAGDVGVGTASPGSLLHVNSAGVASPHSDSEIAASRTQAATTVAQVEIISGNLGTSSIWLSDTDAAGRGRIQYDHSADDLSLWTTSAERLTIDSSGNVGIGGPRTPDTILGIVGDVSIAGTLTTSGPIRIGNTTSTPVIFNVIDDDGTVSNNTVNGLMDATNDLYVEGDIEVSQDVSIAQSLTAADLFVGGSPVAADRIRDDDNDTSVDTETNVDEDMLRFVTDGTERMIIDNVGEVGIGTSNPGTELDVVGDISLSGILTVGTTLRVGSTTDSPAVFNVFDTDATVNTSWGRMDAADDIFVAGDLEVVGEVSFGGNITIAGVIFGDDFTQISGALTGDDLDLRGKLFDGNGLDVDVHDSLSISDHLTVYGDLSSGGVFFVDNETDRVGIGTMDPTDRLHVADVNARVNIQSTNLAAAATTGIELARNDGTSVAGIVLEGVTEKLHFMTNGVTLGTATGLVIDNVRNVGVGEVNPNAQLDVGGDISASGSLTIGSTFRVGNTDGNAAFNVIDDDSTVSNNTVNGLMDAANDLYVEGDIEVSQDVSIAQALTVLDLFVGGSPIGADRIHDDDDDTEVNTETNPDEDMIRFVTDGTERMVLDNVGDLSLTGSLTVDGTTLFVDASTNRVGIGRTTPGALLDLSPSGSEMGLRVDADQPGYSGDLIRVNTVTTTGAFTVTEAGEIGIGTTTPSEFFHIAGLGRNFLLDGQTGSSVLEIDSNTAIMQIDRGDNLAFRTAELRYATNETLYWRVGMFGSDSTGSETNNYYIMDGVTGEEVITVEQGTGNVGINSLTPSAELVVDGDVSISGNLSVQSVIRVGSAASAPVAFNVFDTDATVNTSWGLMDAADDIFVAGDLEVVGEVSFGGNITIAGVIFGDDFTQISGALTGDDIDLRGFIFDGSSDAAPVDIRDNLSVSGNVSIVGDLSVGNVFQTNTLGIEVLDPSGGVGQVEIYDNGTIATIEPDGNHSIRLQGDSDVDSTPAGFSISTSTITFSNGNVQANNAGGASIVDGSSSDILPTVRPRRDDTGTGIGHRVTGAVNLIGSSETVLEIYNDGVDHLVTILGDTTQVGNVLELDADGDGVLDMNIDASGGLSLTGGLTVGNVIRLGNTQGNVTFNAIDDDSTVSNTSGGLMDATNDLFVEGDIEVGQDLSVAQSLTSASLFVAGEAVEAQRIHDDDDDTSVDTETNTDEDVIRFRTNGVERVTIDNVGQVGIGTVNPSAALAVIGDVSVSGDLSIGDVIRIGTTADIPRAFNVIDGDTTILATSIMNDENDLYVGGDVEISRAVSINLDLTVEGQIFNAGGSINTDLDVRGVIFDGGSPGIEVDVLDSLSVSGMLTVAETLRIGGQYGSGPFNIIDADSTINTNWGLMDAADDLFVAGDVEIVGEVSFGGNITIAGVIFGDDFTQISGALTGDDIDVRGKLFDGNGLDVDVHDSLSISENLTVYGDLSSGGIFFVDNATNRVGIGTTDPAESLDVAEGNIQIDTDYYIGPGAGSSLKFVGGAWEPHLNSAQDIFINLDANGNSPGAHRLEIYDGAVDGTGTEIFWVQANGDVSASGMLSVGSYLRVGNTNGAPVAFNAIGTSATLNASSFMNSASDLYIEEDLEIGGRLSIAGDTTIGGVIFSDDATEVTGDLTVTGDLDVRGRVF